MVPACCDAGTVVITWDTGLQLGLVLPSPVLEGVGRPGLWGKQEPGAHVSPAGVVGAPGSSRLVRAGGDFQGWRPGRVGKACLWVPCVRRLLTERAPKHTGLMFVLPSQPGALATLTEQGRQSRELHLLATECSWSLSQLPFWAVATGQEHSGSKACPSPCCPSFQAAGKAAWGTSGLDKHA